MVDVDRIFAELDVLSDAITQRQAQYLERIRDIPPPWTSMQKVNFKTRIKRLQSDLDSWNEHIETLRSKAVRIKDAGDKAALYFRIDTCSRTHEALIDDVITTVDDGNGYLELDPDTINATVTQQQGIPPVAKIPALNIQKFNGDYLKWKTFWQRFDINVHSHPFSKVEKLDALVGLLEGIALEEVAGFEIAEENYDTVVKTLQERFGNSKLILKELYSNLRSIPAATPDAKSIRSTVNIISNMCRQLQNYGVDINNDALQTEIIEKMPPKVQNVLTWFQLKNENITTEMLLDQMKENALKAELESQIFAKKKLFSNEQKLKHFHPNVSKSDTNSFYKPTDTVGKLRCSICDGNHATSNCSKYVSADEKQKQLRAKNCCSKCGYSSHDTKSCFSKVVCKTCNGNHATFLCTSKIPPKKSTTLVSMEKKQGMLMTKQITIINPDTKETTDTVVIFDSGSQQSYVSNRIIKQLKLETLHEEELHVTGFGAKASNYTSSLVKFQIKTKDDYMDIYANSASKIATTVTVVDTDSFDLNNIKTVYKTPDILIGMDYFLDIITSFEKCGKNLYIVNSNVGRMICKNIPKLQTTTVVSLAIEPSTHFDEPENDLQKFWNLEDMGIRDSTKNEEEALILEKFKQNIKFENNRYYVSWPEKVTHDELPTNAGLALGRLKSTFKRLSNDPKLMNDCEKIIDDQIKRGTVEVAPVIPEGTLVHYLSSHAVITPQKTTTKVRMVFDASAKISKHAPSLNDCLIRGPLNMPDLGGILLRIRRGKYMLVGDIEKAFHQVYLNAQDRDAVRFFWAKDPSKPLTNDNLIVYRFIGVPFGIISSPFILWIVILIHLQKLNDKKLQNIDENFYVDNIFLLADEKMDGIQQFKTIRQHFLKASMNIREWLSNDSQINESFPEEIRQNTITTKILGLNWNSDTDTLQIELKQFADTATWTKRKILKFIASTFDPLGFLSPVTVKGRCFMQKLFQEKLQWDEPLNKILLNEWQLIVDDWNGVIEVPRKYVKQKFPESHNIEIHAFADASQQAYCTCIYLRIKTDVGYETPLIFAKTKLQPLNKKLTIPKLEIMGIWLAARIITYVSKQMKLEECNKFIWTDSQISYYWFKKLPKNVFVSNRLKEVLQTNATCYFVPGNLNPADLGTRGISFIELKNSNCWWNGPHFLKQNREQWPKLPHLGENLNDTIIAFTTANETTVLQNVEINREFEIDPTLPYSNIKKVAAVKLLQKEPQDLSATDYKVAEQTLIKQEQDILITTKDIKEFKLFKDDDGIYRLNCRFDHAELVNANPIILPKISSLTKAIIQYTHEKLHHAGIPHTLSKLREIYWIPSGRNSVKKVLSKCKECKYWKGKSFALPQMPNLPSTRVNVSKPFQNVGIDYCGPFKVKGSKEKVWICLFTCFTTRLIHLEPVTSMTTEDFLFAFRRFVARRGIPYYILSDNAKQFKTAATALEEIWANVIKDEQTIKFCNENTIFWDYITERAPWKGGLYERMVSLVKNALKLAIGRRFLHLVEFWTFLCEVESTVNCRPLTYVHSKEPFVIRPIDFISPKVQLQLPTVTVDNENEDSSYLPTTAAGGERLLEHYKKTTEYLQKFWKLWNKDYLNFLRERNDEHKKQRGSLVRQPEVNETVLVYEPDIGRGLWKRARIIELIHSSDHKIRSAKIEYKNGFVTNRSIHHLYPIEEDFDDLASETDHDQNDINLHIQIKKNEHCFSSKNLSHSSHSFIAIPTSTLSSIDHSLSNTNIIDNTVMSIKSPSHLSLEEISSGSLSDTETERQDDLRKCRRAESILRKELKEMKKIVKSMLEEYKTLIVEIENRISNGLLAGDLVIKLEQINDKLTNTIKTRDALFDELRDVRSEGMDARKAVGKYHQK